MPVFTKDNKNFLFIHVPKTGGTSIETVFYQSGWNISYVDFGGQGSLNHLRRCSPQHMHKEMLQSIFNLDKFDEIFMLVRNPYKRLCSEYCWANRANLDSAMAIDPWVKEAIKAYTKDNYILDNHLRPQNEFQVPNTVVYKLEQGFESVLKDIENRHHIKLKIEDKRELSSERISGVSPDKVEMDQSTKKLIYDHYFTDFQSYGYAE